MPTIAILGAGPGLGFSVARRYGREGYRVVLVARRGDALADYVARLAAEEVSADAVVGDLSGSAQVSELADRVRDVGGDPDVVYFAPAASDMPFVPAADLTTVAADSYLRLIFHAMVAAVREFLPHMIEQGNGAILTAQGATALFAPPGMSGPGPAMAAQRNYLQSLGREVSGRGVFVGRLYIAGTIRHSAVDQAMQKARESGAKVPGIGMLDPDKLADRLWKMHRGGRNHEAVAPAWGRSLMPLMATRPVQAMIRRSGL